MFGIDQPQKKDNQVECLSAQVVDAPDLVSA